MPRTLFALSLIALLVTAAYSARTLAVDEISRTIRWNDWPAYENGSNLLALEQVTTILERFEEHEKVRLEIRYPGGEAGRAWAESCARWLVAFGIPPDAIELLPGSGAADQVVLAIVDRRS